MPCGSPALTPASTSSTWRRLRARSDRAHHARAAARLVDRRATATLHDGTTTPARNTVQMIEATGDFVLHFVLPNSTGVLQDVHTGFIHATATAEAVLSALCAALNPNNINPALPFTDNVAVEKHGSTFTITFRGSMQSRQIAYVDGPATVTTRLAGIDYYNVDKLNITLGPGNDVVNVQGTTAVTNLTAAPATTGSTSAPARTSPTGGTADFITGNLDEIQGHAEHRRRQPAARRCMISDEASTAGDLNVRHDPLGRAYARNDSRSTPTSTAASPTSTSPGSRPAGHLLHGDGRRLRGGITIWTASATTRSPSTRRTAAPASTSHVAEHRPRQRHGEHRAEQHATDGTFVLNAQGPYRAPALPDDPGERGRLQHGAGRRDGAAEHGHVAADVGQVHRQPRLDPDGRPGRRPG